MQTDIRKVEYNAMLEQRNSVSSRVDVRDDEERSFDDVIVKEKNKSSGSSGLRTRMSRVSLHGTL